ncbi:MAG TPA: folate-binding protein [Pseudolabrys sp.]|jgi:folate-binding protein YgfZ
MQAAFLPDRGVVKVVGDDARRFLNGLVTADMGKVAPDNPCFAALLTPQGKIIVDFIIAEAPPADGGGFFLDCPRALAPTLVEKLNFYKLRAKVICEDLSEVLGVMAVWSGTADSEYGLCYPDPRLPALGSRIMLPPHLAATAAGDIGADFTDADAFEAHRIALGVPRGGLDFMYGDTFPHEADMDQLNGVDFDKGCYVGQEVVSRVEHRATARNRVVPIAYDEFAPSSGLPIMAGEKQVGTLGSTAKGRGLALMRLDRIEDALAAKTALEAGGVTIRAVKPSWAKFSWPGDTKTAP